LDFCENHAKNYIWHVTPAGDQRDDVLHRCGSETLRAAPRQHRTVVNSAEIAWLEWGEQGDPQEEFFLKESEAARKEETLLEEHQELRD